MQTAIFEFLIGAILLATSLTLLVTRDWRWWIGALAVQYLGVFTLVLPSWPLELAAVKLVAGWMAGTVLGFTRQGVENNPPRPTLVPTGLTFRVLATGLVVIVVFAVAPSLPAWATPISSGQAWGALLLMGMGLLNLGLSSRTLTSILGLLTIFSGFEILYAAVEASTLVAGLLATINLGIALVGAYLIVVPKMDAIE